MSECTFFQLYLVVLLYSEERAMIGCHVDVHLTMLGCNWLLCDVPLLLAEFRNYYDVFQI